MRAIICRDWGDPANLELGELPEPALGPGQVRIRMRAAGVNFADCVLVARLGASSRRISGLVNRSLDMA